MKNGCHKAQQPSLIHQKSFGLRSLNRTNACAGTTVDTLVCVDDVLSINLRDCVGRAFAFARTASDAIVSNNISHCFHLHILNDTSKRIIASTIILTDFLKLSIHLRIFFHVFIDIFSIGILLDEKRQQKNVFWSSTNAIYFHSINITHGKCIHHKTEASTPIHVNRGTRSPNTSTSSFHIAIGRTHKVPSS